MINLPDISDLDGKELVIMARTAVTELLTNNSKISDSKFDSKFDFKSGVFVTLNKKNSLRGCIGYPIPVKRLSNGLMDAAIAAATEDPRFPPVSPNELDDITFEITVLTPPIEIKVNNPQEYLSIIKVGRDGMVVENSFTSGLLLPQVAKEYDWNVEEFLSHTCEKAGLDKNAWKVSSTKISKFEGIIFKEEFPHGDIVRVSC
jgi:uncharacterized protein (TIGR00296 family)|tara:strand:+ start:2729 stop:3337 length:609 start_codon:yes stop_codon:yes gene_type:complete